MRTLPVFGSLQWSLFIDVPVLSPIYWCWHAELALPQRKWLHWFKSNEVLPWWPAAFVYGFALRINMQTGGMWTRGCIVPLLLRDTACFLHRNCLSLTSLLPLKSVPLSCLYTQHPLHGALGVPTPTSIWYQTFDYHWCHQVTNTSLSLAVV